MAREKEVILVSALFDPLYDEVDSMPWTEIESFTGALISNEHREEIFECVERHDLAKGRIADGAKTEDVRTLEAQVRQHAEGLVQVARSTIYAFDPTYKSDGNALQTLSASAGGGPDTIRDLLWNAASTCERILQKLDIVEYTEEDVTQRNANAAGLSAFVEHVDLGSQKRPARASTAWDHKIERERWGISVGRRSKQFQRFAELVLQRPITLDQLSEAFRRAGI